MTRIHPNQMDSTAASANMDHGSSEYTPPAITAAIRAAVAALPHIQGLVSNPLPLLMASPYLSRLATLQRSPAGSPPSSPTLAPRRLAPRPSPSCQLCGPSYHRWFLQGNWLRLVRLSRCFSPPSLSCSLEDSSASLRAFDGSCVR
jgi:hypothetical protein